MDNNDEMIRSLTPETLEELNQHVLDMLNTMDMEEVLHSAESEPQVIFVLTLSFLHKRRNIEMNAEKIYESWYRRTQMFSFHPHECRKNI